MDALPLAVANLALEANLRMSSTSPRMRAPPGVRPPRESRSAWYRTRSPWRAGVAPGPDFGIELDQAIEPLADQLGADCLV
jgi:hypothetical protein